MSTFALSALKRSGFLLHLPNDDPLRERIQQISLSVYDPRGILHLRA